RIQPHDFRTVFVAGSAWGGFEQRREGKTQNFRLETRDGKLPLRIMDLSATGTEQGLAVTKLTGPQDQPLSGHKLERVKAAKVRLHLGQALVIDRGESLIVELSTRT